jgi:DNA-binding NarL/FixJ family response regulator
MPQIDGIEATRRIITALPWVRVIGLSMHEEKDMAAAMYEAGAIAYLSKGGPSEVLLAAVRGEASSTPA